MKSVKGFVLTVLLALVSISASAYDFEVDGIYYNITSSKDLTCNVTYENYDRYTYTGNIVIPESVEYNGRKYTITGIGYLAFYKCSSLVSVDLPSSITTIEDHAFSYCI